MVKRPYAWYFYKNSEGRRVLESTHLREYSSVREFENMLVSHGFESVEKGASLIKYPVFDPVIKYLFNKVSRKKSQSFLTSRPVEFLRKYLRIPILGYYSVECLVKNNK